MKRNVSPQRRRERGGFQLRHACWIFLAAIAAALSAGAQTTRPAIAGVIRIGVTVEDMGEAEDYFDAGGEWAWG